MNSVSASSPSAPTSSSSSLLPFLGVSLALLGILVTDLRFRFFSFFISLKWFRLFISQKMEISKCLIWHTAICPATYTNLFISVILMLLSSQTASI
uniref:Uncharacterized protein n=1 Tax=Lepeophtheirus salmonis TaxID=72036 RepID=A0A0K2T1Q4_LEPSM